ncbi:transcription factor sphG [Aspergillus clavatus NRRL 1]|uniref:Fungal specific transcription factor, putative n=1 Tax=Aspergillus clavatus (strain ATCC 1007 / CBS 513.65 / DSM 816 / NCTC 3887 / NRRL 1 / QM 1276 / 107) TaxID=344612 RepID=A1C8J4_ASPCL|nr:fungal specific transcription factor, putative [Aspergillus clavatus NRRL 1]EAW13631.1 fungal specific transcription factor, putative [Aspergillus clavatus NRRL 1]
MTADSLCAHQREAIQAKSTRKTSSIDFDIIAGFLTNAKRAVNNIDQLVASHVVNVQALLSLVSHTMISLSLYQNSSDADYVKHMVAQQYFSIGLSETLLALAARCAKSIGIHQCGSLHGQLSDEDIQERQNISHCLYILDKAVCWTAGSSPSVPVSDMDLDSSLMLSEHGVTPSLVTRAEMARVEESIYLETYAVQVSPRNEDQVRQFAATTLSRLRACLADAGVDLDKIEKCSESPASDLQLAVRYLCLQLLLVWPHKHHPDQIFQRGPEVARMCLKLLLCLWHSSPDQGSHAVFSSFLASLPPLYLYEVISSSLCGQEPTTDMDMLQEFVDLLQTITNCRAEASYTRRLYQLSAIVTDVLKARHAQHKRQKPPSDGTANSYLMSELLSPPATGYNYMAPNGQETFDSRFDGAVFQDPGSGFASLSPIPSAGGELARSADDFLPQLRGFAKTGSNGNDNFNSLSMEALGDTVFWKSVS